MFSRFELTVIILMALSVATVVVMTEDSVHVLKLDRRSWTCTQRTHANYECTQWSLVK